MYSSVASEATRGNWTEMDLRRALEFVGKKTL
jgi:hypothetical protein